MKRIIFLMMCLVVMGCAANSNTYPAGKSDADWEADEAFCLQKSGKVTGFLSGIPVIFIFNTNANQRYNDCLREKGWLK